MSSMEDETISFNNLTKYFSVNKCQLNLFENVEEIAMKIKELGIGQLVLEVSLDSIWQELRQSLVPKFWQHILQLHEWMSSCDEKEIDHQKVLSDVVLSVAELHQNVAEILPIIQRCEILIAKTGATYESFVNDGVINHFKVHLRATLHSQMPITFRKVFLKFYCIAFDVFYHSQIHPLSIDDDDNCEESIECGGCHYDIDACHCDQIITLMTQVNKQLLELDLLERLCGDMICSLLFNVICEHVKATCRDSYDQSRIGQLEKWVESVVIGWLELVYCGEGQLRSSSQSIQQMVNDNLNQTYMNAFYDTYTRTRIDQLFNIVIEYPESQPALEDIRDCLERTHLRDHLVETLRKAIQTRLLHPGVNTTDVLHAYISTIKALRVLDPKGVLLELVSEPVRHYLRGREDTVRFIVTSLTDDTCSELAEELMVAAPLVLEDSPLQEEENMEAWESWTPDPVHAKCVTSKSQRTADIISMLVNIYGSKEVFITEYRTILADRILSQFSYDTEKEIRYLEHLKIRFGDSLSLVHKCEVMVKDVADSKRINTSILSDENPLRGRHLFPVSAMILSGYFWPSFKEERLELPAEVTKELQVYTEAFQNLKGNRTLCWKPHLGQVELELELKQGILSVTVTPTQAVIIHHFQTKPKWTIEELSSITQIPKTNLRRKITFWQTQGVLKETEPDVFVLMEEEGESPIKVGQSGILAPPTVEGPSCEEDETESIMASAHDQREQELQVFWSYIVGMLTNLDCLSLERIHAMLKMFVQGSVECSHLELRSFLDRKVRQHQLILANGLYRLPKN